MAYAIYEIKVKMPIGVTTYGNKKRKRLGRRYRESLEEAGVEREKKRQTLRETRPS
jgi:hypothetical protein